ERSHVDRRSLRRPLRVTGERAHRAAGVQQLGGDGAPRVAEGAGDGIEAGVVAAHGMNTALISPIRSTVSSSRLRITGRRAMEMARTTSGAVRATTRRVAVAPSDGSYTQNSTIPMKYSHNSSGRWGSRLGTRAS